MESESQGEGGCHWSRSCALLLAHQPWIRDTQGPLCPGEIEISRHQVSIKFPTGLFDFCQTGLNRLGKVNSNQQELSPFRFQFNTSTWGFYFCWFKPVSAPQVGVIVSTSRNNSSDFQRLRNLNPLSVRLSPAAVWLLWSSEVRRGWWWASGARSPGQRGTPGSWSWSGRWPWLWSTLTSWPWPSVARLGSWGCEELACLDI